MATLTYVVGRSGSGKSTSICPIQQAGIQGLNPEETIIINTDQKPLPAPGFTDMYSKEKNNYYKSNDTLEVIEQILKPRDDIIVYLFAHPETTFDDNGSPQERIAVQGQQLKKFVPESFSSIVLYAEPSKMTGQGLKFGFRTVNSGADTCKSPIGLFDEEFIPNDLGYVDTAIRNYYNL